MLRLTKWVTFDCYGTLVDWLSGFIAILTPIAGAKTTPLLHAYHRFEPQVELERPHQPYRRVLTSSLLLAAKEISLPLSQAEARQLPERWGSLPVFSDVEDALAALRANGFMLAVLTNCDEDLFAQTQQSFRRPFDLVITAERVQAYKPSLAHFRCFQNLTRVDQSRWVHVASSWFHDIAPARQLGIKHVWLDRENSTAHTNVPCVRVTSAAALPKVISQLVH